ncbi:trypsin beta-like [Drosophila takahashii]|uniref:trypsin beta-like n=1 Tax=Drosophila takahashii TaxID=29030 RepID=UPI001CF8B532|nr:trypsin alpha-3-like [Drosophila takahashii]
MFIQWALLISSATLIAAGSISISERIVGGQTANISEVPWQAFLQYLGKYDCGAVVFSDEIVITAAHCVESNNPEEYSVRVGSSKSNQGGQVVQISNIIRHENFQHKYYLNDIAVIRLKTKLQLGDSVRPIPLADQAPASGTPALVSGWGDIENEGPSSVDLLKTIVNIVDWNDCRRSYGYISKDQICAAASGKDSCQGDSGGPLVVDGKLVGIVSTGNECAHPYFPGVYANVAVLKPWIENAIKFV